MGKRFGHIISNQRLFPFLSWLPDINSSTTRPDLEAGFVSAILILPQAVALATLAGMPPEYGIYTSIIPVIIASVWGSSWHTLSGPNTAVCVLIAFSVAPFASVGTDEYIGYVLSLTLMAGLIQLATGWLKLGALLDFISYTVISAIILAVALIIIVSAAGSFLGVLSNIDEPFFIRLYQVVYDVPRANGYAVAVGTVTVLSGLLARRYWRRYSLFIAVIVGSLFSYLLNASVGPASTNIELLGRLSLSLLPLSLPTFNLESMNVIRELLMSAFSIAFLGLMQTVVISRSLATKTGQHIDTNQEIIGQGLSNIVAPFLSSFAGSGSFNRSGAHYEAGARTPMAAIYASLLLALMVFAAQPFIAAMPMPAVAGTLILVGYGLIDVDEVRRALYSKHEAVIFFTTFAAALGFGLNAGVFTGLLVSLVNYLWHASTPNVTLHRHVARDGRPVTVATIDGNLFFGSIRHVARALSNLDEAADERNILLLRTDHLTYIDIPAAIFLGTEARRRRERGDDIYVYVTRDNVCDILKKAGCLKALGEDHVIHKDRGHPMKTLLYPHRFREGSEPSVGSSQTALSSKDPDIKALAQRLRATRLLSPLSVEQLTSLLERSEFMTAQPGEVIIDENESMESHLLLIDGELEVRRSWSLGDGREKNHNWILKPAAIDGGFAYLAAGNRIRARAMTDLRYMLIDADSVDELLGWSQQFRDELAKDPELRQRMNLVKHVKVFNVMPLDHIKLVFQQMYQLDVGSGDTVITQGDKGDRYYIIESGGAEVTHSNPLTGETRFVARLGVGDAFGEEALMQNGVRNASVTMTAPGRLLVLNKVDFDEFLRPSMVKEITANAAFKLVSGGRAQWLDVRYDMEFQASHIPKAMSLPLNRLRGEVHRLDPDATYIVYCSNGRRSNAAVFLLRERNIKAASLIGGIKRWPYEVESSFEEPTQIQN